MITLTRTQLDFLLRACNLSEAVVQYDCPNEEFKRAYKVSKSNHRKEINNLYSNLLKTKL
jgi:hypothetical protein